MLCVEAQADLPEQTTILCVDDEAAGLRSFKRIFTPVGYQVLTFESAPDALSMLEDHDINIIISDMRMPELSGFKFLAKAANISPDSVRILLTGHSEIESTINAINHYKIHAYLTKPWQSEELLNTIPRELRHHQQRADLA